MTVLIESRRLNTTPVINLFELDLTLYGQGILRFIAGWNESQTDGSVTFNGNKYYGSSIKADGFDWSGSGQPATPKLSISTTNMDGTPNNTLLSLINDYNNIQGCKVTRIRTYEKFLDGQSGAGATIRNFTKDIYIIDRKTQENKYVVEFELTSILDQTGNILPKNLVVASYCPWKPRYRNVDNTGWVYPIGDDACPYNGTTMYKEDGTTTTNPLLERYSKRVETCCKPRFGATSVLPFGGFPGAGRV